MLRFSRRLYEHLDEQPSNAASINRKVVGNLWEWDYAIIVIESVAGRKVHDNWRISEEQMRDCQFHEDSHIKNQALKKKIRLR